MIIFCFRMMEKNGLTTPRPHSDAIRDTSVYCSHNKCYTTTEFVLLGLGAVIGGVMVGVVGISWFKYSVSWHIWNCCCWDFYLFYVNTLKNDGLFCHWSSLLHFPHFSPWHLWLVYINSLAFTIINTLPERNKTFLDAHCPHIQAFQT